MFCIDHVITSFNIKLLAWTFAWTLQWDLRIIMGHRSPVTPGSLNHDPDPYLQNLFPWPWVQVFMGMGTGLATRFSFQLMLMRVAGSMGIQL